MKHFSYLLTFGWNGNPFDQLVASSLSPLYTLSPTWSHCHTSRFQGLTAPHLTSSSTPFLPSNHLSLSKQSIPLQSHLGMAKSLPLHQYHLPKLRQSSITISSSNQLPPPPSSSTQMAPSSMALLVLDLLCECLLKGNGSGEVSTRDWVVTTPSTQLNWKAYGSLWIPHSALLNSLPPLQSHSTCLSTTNQLS